MHGVIKLQTRKQKERGAAETSLIIDVYHGAYKHTTHPAVFAAVHQWRALIAGQRVRRSYSIRYIYITSSDTFIYVHTRVEQLGFVCSGGIKRKALGAAAPLGPPRRVHLYSKSVPVNEITALCRSGDGVCDSKSEREWRASVRGDTSPRGGFMVVYVSGNSPGGRERRSDSLAERPRLEPDLFLFFSSPPVSSCAPTTSPSPVTC